MVLERRSVSLGHQLLELLNQRIQPRQFSVKALNMPTHLGVADSRSGWRGGFGGGQRLERLQHGNVLFKS